MQLQDYISSERRRMYHKEMQLKSVVEIPEDQTEWIYLQKILDKINWRSLKFSMKILNGGKTHMEYKKYGILR